MAVTAAGMVAYQKSDRYRVSFSIPDADDVLLHVLTTHVRDTETSKPRQWYYASTVQSSSTTPRMLSIEPRELNMQLPGYNYVSA